MIIPHDFHFVWLHGSPTLPIDCQYFVDVWQELHSDWSITWWDGTEFELTNQAQFDAVGNVGARADILRYEILQRHGGVYVDIDVEPCQNIERVIEHCSAFVGKQGSGLGNYVVGATPQHEALKAMVRKIGELDVARIADMKNNAVMRETGPDQIHRVMFDRGDVTAFESDIFDGIYSTHHRYGTWIDPNNPKGLGDRIASVSKMMGIKACKGCVKRGHGINEAMRGK